MLQTQVTNPKVVTFQSFSKGVYGLCLSVCLSVCVCVCLNSLLSVVVMLSCKKSQIEFTY